MNRKALWQLIWFVPVVLAASLFFGWVDARAMQIDTSPAGGDDPFFSTFLSSLADAGLGLVSVLAIPGAGIFWAFRRTRLPALFVLLGGVTYLGGCQVRDAVFGSPRDAAFHALGERLTPLVEAIGAYHSDHHEYPETLDELVPDYLPELPSTGMGNYTNYNYLVGSRAARHEGNPWIIEVYAGYGMGFDQFYYYPLQNYPEAFAYERLGEWAYFHE